MEVKLPPELETFVGQQAAQQGFVSADAYLTALIAKERTREARGWDWLTGHLRPGIEADEGQFVSVSADEAIQRGRTRTNSDG